jgi:DNA-binding NtrC family response regulator
MTQTLLIIDDDPELLKALESLFRIRLPSLEIHSSPSGADGLERCRQKRYHAVLTDMWMPGMDGLAFLQKAIPVTPHTPFVVMTAVGDHSVARRAFDLGAYDFILKPFQRDELVSSIESALTAYRLRRQLEGYLGKALPPGVELDGDDADATVPPPAPRASAREVETMLRELARIESEARHRAQRRLADLTR